MFLGVGSLMGNANVSVIVNGFVDGIVIANGNMVEQNELTTAPLEADAGAGEGVAPVCAAARKSPKTQQVDSHTHMLYRAHPQHVPVDHSRRRHIQTFHRRFGTYKSGC